MTPKKILTFERRAVHALWVQVPVCGGMLAAPRRIWRVARCHGSAGESRKPPRSAPEWNRTHDSSLDLWLGWRLAPAANRSGCSWRYQFWRFVWGAIDSNECVWSPTNGVCGEKLNFGWNSFAVRIGEGTYSHTFLRVNFWFELRWFRVSWTRFVVVAKKAHRHSQKRNELQQPKHFSWAFSSGQTF